MFCFLVLFFSFCPFSKVSIHIIYASRVVDSVVLGCRGPVECSHSIEVPMCPAAGGLPVHLWLATLLLPRLLDSPRSTLPHHTAPPRPALRRGPLDVKVDVDVDAPSLRTELRATWAASCAFYSHSTRGHCLASAWAHLRCACTQFHAQMRINPYSFI